MAAGIYAALDFAMADPAAASFLLVERPGSRAEQRGRYLEGIGRFADLLGDGAPGPHLKATDRAAVHSVAGIIVDHVRSERQRDLGAIGPGLVQVALCHISASPKSSSGRNGHRAAADEPQ